MANVCCTPPHDFNRRVYTLDLIKLTDIHVRCMSVLTHRHEPSRHPAHNRNNSILINRNFIELSQNIFELNENKKRNEANIKILLNFFFDINKVCCC